MLLMQKPIYEFSTYNRHVSRSENLGGRAVRGGAKNLVGRSKDGAKIWGLARNGRKMATYYAASFLPHYIRVLFSHLLHSL